MPPASVTTDDDGAALDAAAQALFRLGRLFGRQPIADLLAGRNGRHVELSRVLVTQAVADASATAAGDAGDREVTVGDVAERLGIDPSTASRLVADTVREGYLTRAASVLDGRRACLALTDAGRALDANSRRFQRAVFEQATRDWSEADRLTFARLFVQFAVAVAEHPALSSSAASAPGATSEVQPVQEASRV